MTTARSLFARCGLRRIPPARRLVPGAPRNRAGKAETDATRQPREWPRLSWSRVAARLKRHRCKRLLHRGRGAFRPYGQGPGHNKLSDEGQTAASWPEASRLFHHTPQPFSASAMPAVFRHGAAAVQPNPFRQDLRHALRNVPASHNRSHCADQHDRSCGDVPASISRFRPGGRRGRARKSPSARPGRSHRTHQYNSSSGSGRTCRSGRNDRRTFSH